MAKTFQEDTQFAEMDANGDGEISDSELAHGRELQQLKIQNERADAQRAMSWFALWGMLLYPTVVVISSWVGLEQATSILGDMASVYFVSVAGILAAFFGAQAFQNRTNGK